MKQGFAKREKLKSTALIGRLFTEGKSVKQFPVKMIYIASDKHPQHQVGVSVPKRKFAKAVDRNRLKRLLRESYRKNKYLIHQSKQSYAIMFIYMSNKKESLAVIEKSVHQCLQKLTALNEPV